MSRTVILRQIVVVVCGLCVANVATNSATAAEDARRTQGKNDKPAAAEATGPSAPRGTLSGRFVFDGQPPAPRDQYPQFSKIDSQELGNAEDPARTVENMYRQFLKVGIRPKTTEEGLLVSKEGGIADVPVWVTNKEIPWTPPAGADWPIATIRFQDGEWSPPMTAVAVGHPLSIENHDPLKAGISIGFQRALNQIDVANVAPGPKSQPLLITDRTPEHWPVLISNGFAPWTRASVFVHRNGFFAVSRADGSFTLPNLPAGEWEFRAWHDSNGFLPYWPKGMFKHTIKSGDNSLGTITLKREHFVRLVPAKEVAPPPQNREQIGEVLGQPVYRDQIQGNNVRDLFFTPVLTKYRETHRTEMTPTEDETRFAFEYYERTSRERLEIEGARPDFTIGWRQSKRSWPVRV